MSEKAVSLSLPQVVHFMTTSYPLDVLVKSSFVGYTLGTTSMNEACMFTYLTEWFSATGPLCCL
jgi:hypothetical protein